MSYQNSVEEQAALELFAKQASAEGIDLEQLDDEQVEAAFGHFVENILPELLEQEGGVVEEYEPGVEDKIAAAQNAIAFDAFVKAASAEGVDLNELDEDDVAELFGAWLVQDVPALFEEQAKEAELLEYAKIAEANLSEMTVMGQHLGEVAADAFLSKIADDAYSTAPTVAAQRPLPTKDVKAQQWRAAYNKRYLDALAKEQAAKVPPEVKRGILGRMADELGGAVGTFRMQRNLGRKDNVGMLRALGGAAMEAGKRHPGAALAAGLGAGALGAVGGYGAYKGVKALKARNAQQAEASKSASAIDSRVLEILAAHGLIEG